MQKIVFIPTQVRFCWAYFPDICHAREDTRRHKQAFPHGSQTLVSGSQTWLEKEIYSVFITEGSIPVTFHCNDLNFDYIA